MARKSHECERCGFRWLDREPWEAEELREWMRYADELFGEVRELRRALLRMTSDCEIERERVAYLQELVRHLEVPTLEQLEIRSLKAALVGEAEPERATEDCQF